MTTEQLIYAGIPLWLLVEYLEDLGGEAAGEGRVKGDGWTASIIKIEPNRVGSLRVGRVQLELQGDPDAIAALKPRLEMKTMRAGA
jgi:hypothetical protein